MRGVNPPPFAPTINDLQFPFHITVDNVLYNSNELLLVAGKGHEVDQDYGKYIRKFSDKKIILKYIKKKNKYLSKNWKVNILEEVIKDKKLLDSKISKASINSKQIKKNNIFFAIKGKKQDGNFFIKES